MTLERGQGDTAWDSGFEKNQKIVANLDQKEKPGQFTEKTFLVCQS